VIIMAIDANIYQAVDAQTPMRLASILDPAVQEQRRLQSAQRDEQMVQMQRADPASIAQTLGGAGFADEAVKYQGLAEAQRQKQQMELDRRTKILKEAHGQVGAMGGSDDAIRQVYGSLGFVDEPTIAKIGAHAASLAPEERQSYFLGLADPNYLTKRQELQMQREARAAEAEKARQAQIDRDKQRLVDKKDMDLVGKPYYTPIYTDQGVVSFDTRTGRTVPVTSNGQPLVRSTDSPELQGKLTGAKTAGKAQATRQFNMMGLGDTITEARTLLSQKPTASGIGTIADTAGAFVGVDVPGADTAEKLRAIGGALTSKMPRMEGPQSDKDVQLYREMAGQVGNSTIPVARRLAALQVVEHLWKKYETAGPATTPAKPGLYRSKSGATIEPLD
jgi:hypothetical protein